ncbi:MAG: hypothetical protein WD940_00470 [Patescibacteria group bacterium]
MDGTQLYEETRRSLLLVHDMLSSCHARIERSRAELEGPEIFNSGLSKVSSRARMAMESLAEALGILEMWERERAGPSDPHEPDDEIDSPA